jgi:hypothetical protein
MYNKYCTQRFHLRSPERKSNGSPEDKTNFRILLGGQNVSKKCSFVACSTDGPSERKAGLTVVSAPQCVGHSLSGAHVLFRGEKSENTNKENPLQTPNLDVKYEQRSDRNRSSRWTQMNVYNEGERPERKKPLPEHPRSGRTLS